MAVSPGSRQPKPGQSSNGCHRELGFKPQTFREEPAHLITSWASQGAAGMVAPSQKGHRGDPTASRPSTSMPRSVPPSLVRHCSSGSAPPAAQSVRHCSNRTAAMVSPKHRASLSKPEQFEGRSTSQQVSAESIPEKVNSIRQSPRVAG